MLGALFVGKDPYAFGICLPPFAELDYRLDSLTRPVLPFRVQPTRNQATPE